MTYNHHIIAHGKALAECLSQRRPLSDSKYGTTFIEYDLWKGKIQRLFHLSSTTEQPPVGLQALPTTECQHT